MPAPDRSEPTDIEALLGAIARGWCHPDNAHKVMDEKLAEAIMDEVFPLFVQARDHDGYRLVPEGEWRALEAEWGRYQDGLRTIATTTSKWTDCAAIAAAALSVPEVTDER